MTKTQEQILKELFELAESIGMSIFFNSEGADIMDGFIIGTEDFFRSIQEGNEDLDNYDKVLAIERTSKEDMH